MSNVVLNFSANGKSLTLVTCQNEDLDTFISQLRMCGCEEEYLAGMKEEVESSITEMINGESPVQCLLGGNPIDERLIIFLYNAVLCLPETIAGVVEMVSQGVAHLGFETYEEKTQTATDAMRAIMVAVLSDFDTPPTSGGQPMN